jgi:hypothetical protein
MRNQQNNNGIQDSHDDVGGKDFLGYEAWVFRPALEAGSLQNVNKYIEHTRRHVPEDDKHEHYTVHSPTQQNNSAMLLCP